MALRTAFTQSIPLARRPLGRAISPVSSIRTSAPFPHQTPVRPGPAICMSTTPTPPPPTQTSPVPTPPSPTSSPSSTPQTYPITLLYDGDCPLCLKEIAFLRKRQSRLNVSNIRFTDIADPGYDAASHANIDYETAMGVIHAITADGRVVTGVPVFRLAYEGVGLGWVYAITKVRGIGWLVSKAYDFWAERRLAWTGRADMNTVMEMRRDKVEKGCKSSE